MMILDATTHHGERRFERIWRLTDMKIVDRVLEKYRPDVQKIVEHARMCGSELFIEHV
jgi:hypothetical protein